MNKTKELLKLLKEVADNQHYETSDGEPKAYSLEHLTDLYTDKINEILRK